MNAAHLHLIVNHVPVLLTLFSVLVLAWGMAQSNKSFQQLALVGFVLAGVFSFVALQSGEEAEEIVEDLPGVTEHYIHEHEEAAEVTNWIAVLLGVASLAGLGIMRSSGSVKNAFMVVLLVGGIASAGLFVYTAYLGGQVRHTEIRPASSVQQPIQNSDE